MFPGGKEHGVHNQEKVKVNPVLLEFMRLIFISYLDYAERMCLLVQDPRGASC